MELLNKWEELLNLIESQLENSRVVTDSISKIYAISFYCSIVQFSKSIHLLFKNNLLHSIAVLMRSQSEAFVDMANLLDNDDYFNYLHANDLDEKIKFNKEYKNNPDNRYLSKMKLIKDYDIQFQNLVDELESLKLKGFYPISMFDKFKKNSSEETYRTIYNLFCRESHNNLSAIDKRHVIFDDKNLPYLTLMNYTDFKGYYPFIDTNIRMLMNGFESISEFLKLEEKEKILIKIKSFQGYLKSEL